jgi:hypothetical protein
MAIGQGNDSQSQRNIFNFRVISRFWWRTKAYTKLDWQSFFFDQTGRLFRPEAALNPEPRTPEPLNL